MKKKLWRKKMRNPNRLDSFYDELKELHKAYVPDWRFSQFIINFIGWHENKYGIDPFYIEEDKCLKRFKEMLEYMKEVKVC